MQNLYIGPFLENSEHQHSALQVSIALDNPFHLRANDQSQEYRSAIIAPNIPHQLSCPSGHSALLILFLDHEIRISKLIISHLLQSDKIATFDKLHYSSPLRTLVASDNGIQTPQKSAQIIDLIVSTLLEDYDSAIVPLDGRIADAIERINSLDVIRISLQELAESVYLSESRFAHLFKEQLGIPIRRYLLWMRMIRALKMVMQDISLTEAAHQTGFSDSAHFSRTFRSMFGMSPSYVFKNDQFIQVISCLDG